MNTVNNNLQQITQRIALCLEYDGSFYHGWQRQPAASSVQETLEIALSRVADQDIQVICAGRTDAGVHALAQIVHFDTTAARSSRAWVLGSNTFLPKTITTHWAVPVSSDFNARRSAHERHYRYILYNHPIRPSLLKDRVGWYHNSVSEQKMQEASQHWLGEQDFSTFRGADCQSKSPIRRVKQIKVSRQGDFVFFDIAANAFLHHMVRNMVGALLKVGSGKESPGWAREILIARDRSQAGITAPPQGLYLVKVEYPVHFGLPTMSMRKTDRYELVF